MAMLPLGSSAPCPSKRCTNSNSLRVGRVDWVRTTETILSPFTTTRFIHRVLRDSFTPNSLCVTLHMQPGTPMADLFPPGHAALRNPRRPNPPPGFGPRQGNHIGMQLFACNWKLPAYNGASYLQLTFSAFY